MGGGTFGNIVGYPNPVRLRPPALPTSPGLAANLVATSDHRARCRGTPRGGVMDDMDATGHVAAIIEGLDPGALVTKFVVVAEVIDTDGERAIWTDTSDGASRWDTYGLLTYAIEEERSNHHVTAMNEGES